MDFKNDIDACVACLKEGRIILYPTDTIWGIGCDATNEIAVAKIYALKKREETKSMIILLAEENNISRYAKTPSAMLRNELHKSAQPLSVIYPEAKNLAANLINGDGTIAIRLVKDEFCKAMITALGSPIVSTSANISGDVFAGNFNDVSPKIKTGADYIVKWRREDKSYLTPSTILKWTTDDKLQVIRK